MSDTEFKGSSPNGKRTLQISKGAIVAVKPGLGTVMRTLGRQIKERLAASLGLQRNQIPQTPPRVYVVDKVSRNALYDLVSRAKSHPQKGDKRSPNPAYVALAELAEECSLPGLALGLKYESGEISFLDLDLDADKIKGHDGAFVDKKENIKLWRRLEDLIYKKVDSTMVGPRKPIRPLKRWTYENRY